MIKIKDMSGDVVYDDLKYVVHAKEGRHLVWLSEDLDGALEWVPDLDSAKVYDDKDDIPNDVARSDYRNLHAVEIHTINPDIMIDR